MAYICRNIDNASQLKIWPDVIFSPPLENYINQLADVHSMHPDSLAIVLINCVASTTEFSYVLRANSIDKKIPTTFYNIIVARSCKSQIYHIYACKVFKKISQKRKQNHQLATQIFF